MLYKIVRPLIAFFMKLVYRPQIKGLENVFNEGPLILAGNHTNNLDSLLLMSSLKRPIHFLGKHTLFKGLLGPFMKAMHIIPVNRTAPKNLEARLLAGETLNSGQIIGIFPEGTINRTDDLIMSFKMGAVYLAQKAAVPIVPFVITGSYKPFHKNIKLTYLPAIEVKDENLTLANSHLMKLIADELEERRK